ncbi:MAG: D-alanyl-D-alanine carboxypeptidase/D-alanyl-D-alanine-endopeptidase [Oscillospiraceae bacterium]|jgi:D-alanyl-D-alanine carboxypeptidase/D-alanyl-D-alanine-endopeptidase (penicillin-binding protein 4)|nr:D-alanyl-D-alanine carboxypeptidase/D-alanyl-D-alanine-endopeptidase [Oscillospiraceae bacterium]
MKKLLSAFAAFLIFASVPVSAVTPQCVTDFMQTDSMKNADFALIVKDMETGEIVYDYNIKNSVVPASTLKTVTTATALEIFGADYRYETLLQYDGEIKDGVLHGNIHIKGSGDPSLGSEYFENQTKFLDDWAEAIQKLGIKKITGRVIADESIFDNQGTHPRWQAEDLGLGYGAGSYGINIFDNRYRLYLKSGEVGSKPTIEKTAPEMKFNFINTLTVSNNAIGGSIFGVPFSNERYLNGSLSPNSSKIVYGDISDPAVYVANLLTDKIENIGISTKEMPTCSRLLIQSGKSLPQERKHITTTYSPALGEIVKVTNYFSRNLYADALLKTIGTLHPKTDKPLTSFEKGINILKKLWHCEKGIDCSLILYDGSGLAPVNRVTATFVSEILEYMATKSVHSEAFINSFPMAGVNGTANNFLRGTCLQGKAALKSGWMTGVQCYAGYITRDRKKYIVGVFANNYHCNTLEINKAIENILLNLFS